jgi:hypothetical protein
VGFHLLQSGGSRALLGDVEELPYLSTVGAAQDTGWWPGCPVTDKLERGEGVGENHRGALLEGEDEGDELTVGTAARGGDGGRDLGPSAGTDGGGTSLGADRAVCEGGILGRHAVYWLKENGGRVAVFRG